MLLVSGGCRSGKSAFAQVWIQEQSPARVYMATALVAPAGQDDPELLRRIALHQAARGQGWVSVEPGPELWEDPEAAVHAASRQGGALLFDCLTLWVSGCFEHSFSDAVITERASTLLATLAALAMPVAVVTNELGLGLVPGDALSRRFRDMAGLVNQTAANKASDAVFLVSGLPLVLKRNSALSHP